MGLRFKNFRNIEKVDCGKIRIIMRNKNIILGISNII